MAAKVTGKCAVVSRVFFVLRALRASIILMTTVILAMVELTVLVFASAMSPALLWIASLLTIVNISIQHLIRMVAKPAVGT
jgi:hypothetical protein